MRNHAEDIKNFDYILLSQDGIARLDRANAPASIGGIFTNGVESCLIIMIAGAKHVTMIHATAKMSAKAIANEFKLAGKVIYWTIGYNPMFYPQKRDSEELITKVADFIIQIEDVTGPNKYLKEKNGSIKLCETNQGFVTFTRRGTCETNTKPKKLLMAGSIGELKLRNQINQVNNFFLSDNEEMIPDLQRGKPGYVRKITPQSNSIFSIC